MAWSYLDLFISISRPDCIRVNGNNRVEHFVFVILKFNNSVQIPLCQFLVVQATRLNMSLNGGNVLF
jgi:hypothetical protein